MVEIRVDHYIEVFGILESGNSPRGGNGTDIDTRSGWVINDITILKTGTGDPPTQAWTRGKYFRRG